ncbi:HSA domain-containing protein [Aphelenchoides fujianensis]|nr:HSA domain-containing protein [Aphelenchoides fujianensis]
MGDRRTPEKKRRKAGVPKRKSNELASLFLCRRLIKEQVLTKIRRSPQKNHENPRLVPKIWSFNEYAPIEVLIDHATTGDKTCLPSGQTSSMASGQSTSGAISDVELLDRVNRLRRSGKWALTRLPLCMDAPRAKTHWDYLLEEMYTMHIDFASDQKLKRIAAKMLAEEAKDCRRNLWTKCADLTAEWTKPLDLKCAHELQPTETPAPARDRPLDGYDCFRNTQPLFYDTEVLRSDPKLPVPLVPDWDDEFEFQVPNLGDEITIASSMENPWYCGDVLEPDEPEAPKDLYSGDEDYFLDLNDEQENFFMDDERSPKSAEDSLDAAMANAGDASQSAVEFSMDFLAPNQPLTSRSNLPLDHDQAPTKRSSHRSRRSDEAHRRLTGNQFLLLSDPQPLVRPDGKPGYTPPHTAKEWVDAEVPPFGPLEDYNLLTAAVEQLLAMPIPRFIARNFCFNWDIVQCMLRKHSFYDRSKFRYCVRFRELIGAQKKLAPTENMEIQVVVHDGIDVDVMFHPRVRASTLPITRCFIRTVHAWMRKSNAVKQLHKLWDDRTVHLNACDQAPKYKLLKSFIERDPVVVNPEIEQRFLQRHNLNLALECPFEILPPNKKSPSLEQTMPGHLYSKRLRLSRVLCTAKAVLINAVKPVAQYDRLLPLSRCPSFTDGQVYWYGYDREAEYDHDDFSRKAFARQFQWEEPLHGVVERRLFWADADGVTLPAEEIDLRLLELLNTHITQFAVDIRVPITFSAADMTDILNSAYRVIAPKLPPRSHIGLTDVAQVLQESFRPVDEDLKRKITQGLKEGEQWLFKSGHAWLPVTLGEEYTDETIYNFPINDAVAIPLCRTEMNAEFVPSIVQLGAMIFDQQQSGIMAMVETTFLSLVEKCLFLCSGDYVDDLRADRPPLAPFFSLDSMPPTTSKMKKKAEHRAILVVEKQRTANGPSKCAYELHFLPGGRVELHQVEDDPPTTPGWIPHEQAAVNRARLFEEKRKSIIEKYYWTTVEDEEGIRITYPTRLDEEMGEYHRTIVEEEDDEDIQITYSTRSDEEKSEDHWTTVDDEEGIQIRYPTRSDKKKDGYYWTTMEDEEGIQLPYLTRSDKKKVEYMEKKKLEELKALFRSADFHTADFLNPMAAFVDVSRIQRRFLQQIPGDAFLRTPADGLLKHVLRTNVDAAHFGSALHPKPFKLAAFDNELHTHSTARSASAQPEVEIVGSVSGQPKGHSFSLQRFPLKTSLKTTFQTKFWIRHNSTNEKWDESKRDGPVIPIELDEAVVKRWKENLPLTMVVCPKSAPNASASTSTQRRRSASRKRPKCQCGTKKPALLSLLNRFLSNDDLLTDENFSMLHDGFQFVCDECREKGDVDERIEEIDSDDEPEIPLMEDEVATVRRFFRSQLPAASPALPQEEEKKKSGNTKLEKIIEQHAEAVIKSKAPSTAPKSPAGFQLALQVQLKEYSDKFLPLQQLTLRLTDEDVQMEDMIVVTCDRTYEKEIEVNGRAPLRLHVKRSLKKPGSAFPISERHEPTQQPSSALLRNADIRNDIFRFFYAKSKGARRRWSRLFTHRQLRAANLKYRRRAIRVAERTKKAVDDIIRENGKKLRRDEYGHADIASMAETKKMLVKQFLQNPQTKYPKKKKPSISRASNKTVYVTRRRPNRPPRFAAHVRKAKRKTKRTAEVLSKAAANVRPDSVRLMLPIHYNVNASILPRVCRRPRNAKELPGVFYGNGNFSQKMIIYQLPEDEQALAQNGSIPTVQITEEAENHALAREILADARMAPSKVIKTKIPGTVNLLSPSQLRSPRRMLSIERSPTKFYASYLNVLNPSAGSSPATADKLAPPPSAQRTPTSNRERSLPAIPSAMQVPASAVYHLQTTSASELPPTLTIYQPKDLSLMPLPISSMPDESSRGYVTPTSGQAENILESPSFTPSPSAPTGPESPQKRVFPSPAASSRLWARPVVGGARGGGRGGGEAGTSGFPRAMNPMPRPELGPLGYEAAQYEVMGGQRELTVREKLQRDFAMGSLPTGSQKKVYRIPATKRRYSELPTSEESSGESSSEVVNKRSRPAPYAYQVRTPAPSTMMPTATYASMAPTNFVTEMSAVRPLQQGGLPKSTADQPTTSSVQLLTQHGEPIKTYIRKENHQFAIQEPSTFQPQQRLEIRVQMENPAQPPPSAASQPQAPVPQQGDFPTTSTDSPQSTIASSR